MSSVIVLNNLAGYIHLYFREEIAQKHQDTKCKHFPHFFWPRCTDSNIALLNIFDLEPWFQVDLLSYVLRARPYFVSCHSRHRGNHKSFSWCFWILIVERILHYIRSDCPVFPRSVRWFQKHWYLAVGTSGVLIAMLHLRWGSVCFNIFYQFTCRAAEGTRSCRISSDWPPITNSITEHFGAISLLLERALAGQQWYT